MKKTFSYEEAAVLLPEVQRLTSSAVEEVEALASDAPRDAGQQIVAKWAEAVMKMGIDVKGLWLIDFDNGSGYYCWQYPEESLQYFHGYEEGFGGRVKLQCFLVFVSRINYRTGLDRHRAPATEEPSGTSTFGKR